jgi:hypothetical protein
LSELRVKTLPLHTAISTFDGTKGHGRVFYQLFSKTDSNRPFNILRNFSIRRKEGATVPPVNRGLPSRIHYYGIKYKKMSLEPKRKYLAKQTLTNKYSAFKSAYHLEMAFCC